MVRKPKLKLPRRLAPRLKDALTPRQQEILVLLESGRSFGDIAEALSIRKSTAYQHAAYARAKLLQQRLRRQGFLAPDGG